MACEEYSMTNNVYGHQPSKYTYSAPLDNHYMSIRDQSLTATTTAVGGPVRKDNCSKKSSHNGNLKKHHHHHHHPRPSSEDEMPDDQPIAWKTVCLHFTQNTTFHGMNKITESTPFVLRRVLWALIVLGGMSLFVYQMTAAVLHYLARPVTVNIKINYNKTVKFPAITVCNQNVFRTSQAAEHKYYFLIDDLFSNKDVNLMKYNATNVSMMDLYSATAHDKHDMIVSCMWDKKPCSVDDDFTTSITDHGQCYTFNGHHNISAVLNATQTGSDRGLSLRLNVEQYEYMRGPNSAAGVKILVHDQEEIPLVRELGQAISPGSHAFVGIQMLQINNLKLPYGECSNDNFLEYFNHYTIPACLVDCKERFLRDNCRCRLAYMPEDSKRPGNPPVCTFGQQQECVNAAINSFHEWGEDKCHCPVPCTRKMFETTISYATTSKFDTDRDIRSSNTEDLARRFISARETVQRVDLMVSKKDAEQVRILRKAAVEVCDTYDHIKEKMENVSAILDSMMLHMNYRTWFHKHQGLRVIDRAVTYGFIQGWDIEQQSTFEPLASGTKEFLKSYKKTMIKILNVSMEESSFRHMLAWSIEDELSTRRDLCTRALDGIKLIHSRFQNAESILHYQWSIEARYDQYYIPKALLQHRSMYQITLYNIIVADLETLNSMIGNLSSQLQSAVERNEFNETLFEEIRVTYLESVQNFNYGHNLFKDAIVYRTKQLVEDRQNSFQKKTEVLLKECGDTRLTVENSLDLVSTMKKDIWPGIEHMLVTSEEYVTNTSRSKTQLAKLVFSENVEVRLQQMDDFFTDVRARARNFDHDWRKFQNAYLAVWNSMKDEDTLFAAYEKLHQDFQRAMREPASNFSRAISTIFTKDSVFKNLETRDLALIYRRINADLPVINKTAYLARMRVYFTHVLHESNIAMVVNEKDDKFFEVMSRWQASLGRYLKQSEIDETFFRENFLEIDVFMKELYYEQIEQQIAYDLTNLWSDIGGSMGLFVGASVITVFELGDAILHNLCKMQLRRSRMRHRHRRKRRDYERPRL